MTGRDRGRPKGSYRSRRTSPAPLPRPAERRIGRGPSRRRTFTHKLLSWFKNNARSFPWRTRPTAYRIAVAECILQKTSAANALPVFSRVISEYPTLQRLSAADPDRLAELLRPLGLPRRAQLLLSLANILVREKNGRFPRSEEELVTLPGIGPYGAAAIASLAFGQRVPMIDRNVMRIIGRVFSVESSPRRAPSKLLRQTVLELMPRVRPETFNLALVDFGAMICRTRDPKCGACPLQSICDFRSALSRR